MKEITNNELNLEKTETGILTNKPKINEYSRRNPLNLDDNENTNESKEPDKIDRI